MKMTRTSSGQAGGSANSSGAHMNASNASNISIRYVNRQGLFRSSHLIRSLRCDHVAGADGESTINLNVANTAQ